MIGTSEFRVRIDKAREALNELAPVDEVLTRLYGIDQELAQKQAALASLTSQITAAERALADRQTALKADEDRQAKSHAAAEATMQARIDGLVAQERSLEKQIERKRQDINLLSSTHAQAAVEQEQLVARLDAQRRDAEAELAAARQKLTDFHASIANVAR